MNGTETSKCGSCTSCCFNLAVDELKKPGKQTCQHICPTGCLIHATKPRECRSYECFWYNHDMPPQYRPDVWGLQVDLTHGDFGPVLVVHETIPLTFDNEEKRALVLEWARILEGCVYLVRGVEDKRLIFPAKVEPSERALSLLRRGEHSEQSGLG